MSSVKIQGSATGTANFTIAVPDGTSTDRTIELPDAAGSFVTANASGDVAVTGDLTVDTNTLYVDSANNRIGVGTSSPSRQLSIIDSTNPFLQLALSTDAAANNGLEIVMDASGAYFQNRENTPTIFSTNNTERMRIASDGSVGIGTSSPSNYYANHLVVDIGSSAQSGITIVSDTSNQGMFAFADGTTGDQRYRGAIDYNHSNDSMAFLAGGAEAMRVSGGNLIVGTTSGSARINSYYTGGTAYSAKINASGSGMEVSSEGFSNTMTALSFRTNYGAVGSITCGSSTAYNTSSDYRLKENVTELTGAIDRVKQLPVHRFNFIVDPDKTVDGFLAHEVADVVPEAVTGTKDAMKTEEYEVTPAVLDDDENVVTEAVMGTREVPDYQGIDQSKLVPLLTAAIKEQQALIEDLQTRLATLEAV